MLKQPFLKKALFNSLNSKLIRAADQDSAVDVQKQGEGSVAASAIALESPTLQKSEHHPSRQSSSKSPRFFNRIPKRKAAFALAVLGAGSGLAFTQVAPESLKESLSGQETSAPLRQASDPPIEPMAKGNRVLFLTNEIFYRKIEAIAQVPRNSSPASTGTGSIGTSTSAPQEKTRSSAQTATTASKASAKKTVATAKPTQAERVVAAAPPAPTSAPVEYAGTTIDNVLEMRVAVAKDVSAVSLATSGGGTITDLDGNLLKTLSPESAVLAEINGGIMLDGQPMPSAFWVYPEDGGYVAVGSSWYRGRALVALRERGLIAVNYVLLGDYLYSVVGTEVSPNWPIESMKAQAVAARSYALTHNISPASEAYFDLDNTQRFQAYKGISHEADTTQAAVQATSGEFISHDGGIVESLYAASQAIVDDAHKGSGMSQLGAKDLANQGYSYTEILAHYYPGTGLGRIETDTN